MSFSKGLTYNHRNRIASIDSMADALRKLNGYNKADAFEAINFLVTTPSLKILWDYIWKPQAIPDVVYFLITKLGEVFLPESNNLSSESLLEIVNRHPIRKAQIAAARVLAAENEGALPNIHGKIATYYNSQINQNLLDATAVERYIWANPSASIMGYSVHEKTEKKLTDIIKEVMLSREPPPPVAGRTSFYEGAESLNGMETNPEGTSAAARFIGEICLYNWNKADGVRLLECSSRYNHNIDLFKWWIRNADAEVQLAPGEKRQIQAISRTLLERYAVTVKTNFAAADFFTLSIEDAKWFADRLRSINESAWNEALERRVGMGLVNLMIRKKAWKDAGAILRSIPKQYYNEEVKAAIKDIAQVINESDERIDGIADLADVSPGFFPLLWEQVNPEKRYKLIEVTGKNLAVPQLQKLTGVYGEKMDDVVSKFLTEKKRPKTQEVVPQVAVPVGADDKE